MQLKKKSAWLIAALALAALPVMQAAAKVDYYYNFNDTLKPWSNSADGSGKHSLQIMTEDDPGGERPLNMYANLAAGDVTFSQDGVTGRIPVPVGNWMLASYPSDSKMIVRARLLARSGSACEGCILKAYAGSSAPMSITQFSEVKSDSGLKKYWQEFTYEGRAGSDSPVRAAKSQVYVAFGWSGTDASIDFDNIELEMFPAP